jgi:hypothetical protein
MFSYRLLFLLRLNFKEIDAFVLAFHKPFPLSAQRLWVALSGGGLFLNAIANLQKSFQK